MSNRWMEREKVLRDERKECMREDFSLMGKQYFEEHFAKGFEATLSQTFFTSPTFKFPKRETF